MRRSQTESIRPADIPNGPLGTLAEIKEAGLNPIFFGCCAPKQDKVSGGGCPKYGICGYPERDVSGPENHAYRITTSESQGGIQREDVAPCFVCLDIQESVESNGGLYEDLGGPGTEFVRVGTRRWAEARIEEWKAENGEGETPPQELRSALYNSDHPMFGVYERWEHRNVVKPFLRPHENPKLAKWISKQDLRKRIEREKREEKRLMTHGVGLTDADKAEDADAERVGVRARPRPARPRGEGQEA